MDVSDVVIPPLLPVCHLVMCRKAQPIFAKVSGNHWFTQNGDGVVRWIWLVPYNVSIKVSGAIGTGISTDAWCRLLRDADLIGHRIDDGIGVVSQNSLNGPLIRNIGANY